MNKKILAIVTAVFVLAAGSALAQMGGGHMGGGIVGSHMGGSNFFGGSTGYGMHGAGGIVSGMMGNTMAYGYLDTFTPVTTEQEARTAIQGFIDLVYSDLAISELWEYGSVYKAELSDTNGAKAFDLIVDKLTGAVSPEMGMSMMLNATYGRGLYRMTSFGTSLTLTPQQATDIAQTFVDKNALGYTLDAPESYPGYYKFHTTTLTGFGMDIMVNGYNGRVWMNTILGLPLNRYK